MRIILTALVFVLGFSGSAGAVDNLYKGNGLHRICQERSPVCLGYVMGITDAISANSGELADYRVCLPRVTAVQLRDVVKLWLEIGRHRKHN